MYSEIGKEGGDHFNGLGIVVNDEDRAGDEARRGEAEPDQRGVQLAPG